jgi:hypothetical protein
MSQAGNTSPELARSSNAFVDKLTLVDILESIEVRWYLPSDATTGADLDQWFASIKGEGERTDHYLATGRADLSFKARMQEGKSAKLEAKYLVGTLGIVDLTPKISGEIQRWTKLSLASSDPELNKNGTWISVKKDRRLRKFDVSLAPEATAREVPASSYPKMGCGVELTRLGYDFDAKTHSEWTFGFEAFGPKTQLLDILQATIRAIASDLPDLQAAWTASYASWLLSKTEAR